MFNQLLSYDKYNFRQCLLAVVVLIDCIIGGAEFSYAATLLPQLDAPDSTIKMTENEGIWFASFLNLFGVPGTILGIFILEWLGRKWTYALVAFVNIITWSIIALSTESWHLFAARIIQGVNLGISFPVCLCFISEVTSCKYRSSFLNILNIGLSMGMLLADVLGSYYSWRLAPVVIVCLSVTYFLILLYLQNTHVWHLHRKEMEQAKSAYFWYNPMNTQNMDDFNEQVQEIELQNNTSRKQLWLAVKQQDFLIPLGLVLWFYTTSTFSGGYAIASYTVTVMKNVVAYDEYRTTIFIDIIRLLAAFLTAAAIKFMRVRVIINLCVVLCMVSLLTLCAGLYWQDEVIELQWVVLGAILFYTVVYNIGIINMCNISLGELFTGITKPLGTSVVAVYFLGMTFLVTMLIPRMFNEFGNIGTFMVFAGLICIGGIGMFVGMPETKNVTNEQIKMGFMKRFNK